MMNLSPTELDRMVIFTAAEMADAVALITDEVMFAARQDQPFEEIRDWACRLLTSDDVEPGVASMVTMLYIECLFAEGAKVMALFDPIGPGEAPVEGDVTPGEILTPDEDIEIFDPALAVTLDVVNTGDRDVQGRSHTHFFEANRALRFDRAAAWGMKVDRPAGLLTPWRES